MDLTYFTVDLSSVDNITLAVIGALVVMFSVRKMIKIINRS